MGFAALLNNTTGKYNTANGEFALYSNTTGNKNTATGVSALFENTNGREDTATGDSALENNTIGVQNTANGVVAPSPLGDSSQATSPSFRRVNRERRLLFAQLRYWI
jgi:hypothetical protein